MDKREVLRLFDRRLRREARPDGPGAKVEDTGLVVRHVGPAHGWNGVLWSGLDDDTADAAIAGEVRYFGALGREFEWKLYAHDRPADLDRRLLAAGFAAEPAETLMVAEIEQVPDFAPPEGVRLVPVTDARGVELMAAVHGRAFGEEDGEFREFLLARLAAGALTGVVAMAGDEPVSSGRLEPRPGTEFAGLWGGGTVPEWRGRGVFRALVSFRARLAAAQGYTYLQVDASSESRPILARLGFAELTTTTPYVHP